MEPDVPNPAFQQAIPPVVLVFAPLFKVVFFGSLLGVPQGTVFGRSREHPGGPFRDDLGSNFRTDDEMEMKREPISWLQLKERAEGRVGILNELILIAQGPRTVRSQLDMT